MGANVSALGAQAKRKAIVARTLSLVGTQPPGARLARAARRDARPLPGLALGSAAAADDRPGGDALLSGLHREMATVEDLAAASLEAVIGAFAGLGYYSRARNLHACAKEIARRGGRFPSEEADLRALPGVGAYTAAAIAAIAFGRQAAPVDGNIARILARLLALERRSPRARAKSRRRRARSRRDKRAGDFAQALMDIGATICRPRNPDCGSCPLSGGLRRVADRRARGLSAPRGRRRQSRAGEGAVFFARRADGAFLARRRPPRGLLASTVELPGTPWTGEGAGRRAGRRAARSPRAGAGCRATVEQVFTHFALRLTVYAGAFRGRRAGRAFLGRAAKRSARPDFRT